jgi:hypothetical protein
MILKQTTNGTNNNERRTVSIDTSDRRILEGIVLVNQLDCFELCDILRLKLTGYVNELNLHIMNDNSGNFIGCMCK